MEEDDDDEINNRSPHQNCTGVPRWATRSTWRMYPTILNSCKVGTSIQKWRCVKCWHTLQHTLCVCLQRHDSGHNWTLYGRKQVKESAEHIRISQCTVLQIIRRDLQMRNTAAQLVQHHLNEVQATMNASWDMSYQSEKILSHVKMGLTVR
jgi:hypothetical protein